MLKDMKVKKSLLLGFAIVIGISVAIIVSCLFMMNQQKGQYDELLAHEVVANEEILYARVNAVMAGRTVRDILLTPDDPANDSFVKEAEDQLNTAREHVAALQAAYPAELDKTLLNNYVNAFEAWAVFPPQLLDYYDRYDSTKDHAYITQASQMILNQDNPAQTKMAETADELDAFLVASMDGKVADIAASFRITLIVLIVIMVVATIVVIAFAMALIKSITAPTEEVRRALVGFSEGKLDIPVNFTSKNELGEMCDALRRSQNVLGSVIRDIDYLLKEMASGNFDINSGAANMYVGALTTVLEAIRGINSNLSDTMAQITQSADQVSAGSEQVSIGAQALAQGSTEQASAVEQLSATINEVAHNAQESARNSERALQNSREAGEMVAESAKYMEQMVQAMKNISESSEEIGKIIAVIENIAFQTNILALNAAVEAARAGTAGKGFAVVADEVRNLASKSDEAAKATKELIERSVNSVKEGDEIVKSVSDALNRTIEATNRSMADIQQIAAAVEQEAESITQVTEGVDQISSVVQTNSATSEQSAAASEELSSQASLMKELMLRFKLKDDAGSYGAAHTSYSASDYDMGGGDSFSKY